MLLMTKLLWSADRPTFQPSLNVGRALAETFFHQMRARLRADSRAGPWKYTRAGPLSASGARLTFAAARRREDTECELHCNFYLS